MAKTCDIKCFELAEHFLADHPALKMRNTSTYELALQIQQSIEDWFIDMGQPFGEAK